MSSAPAESAPLPPEFRHWRQNLVVLWTTQFLTNIAFSISLPFCAYFVRELSPGASEERVRMYAALSAMMPQLAYTICAPLWGWVADRFGRKRMILRATFGGCLALLLMSFAQNAWQFLWLRLFQGMLTGSVTASLTLISATTPSEKQGFAMGAMSSAVFAGDMSGLFIGGLLASHFGYRNSFRISSVLLAFCTVLVIALVHETFKAVKSMGKGNSWAKIGAVWGVLGPAMPVMILVTVAGLAQLYDGSQAALYIEQLNGLGFTGKELCTSLIMGAGSLGAVTAGFTVSRLIDRHPFFIGIFSGVFCAFTMLAMAILPDILPMSPRVDLGWLGVPDATATPCVLGLLPLRFLMVFGAGTITPICHAWISKVTLPAHRGMMFDMSLAFRAVGASVTNIVAGLVAAGISLRAVYWTGPVFFLLFALLIWLFQRQIQERCEFVLKHG